MLSLKTACVFSCDVGMPESTIAAGAIGNMPLHLQPYALGEGPQAGPHAARKRKRAGGNNSQLYRGEQACCMNTEARLHWIEESEF